MGLVRMILGAKSKYDKSLPFVYEARFDALSGQGEKPIIHSYFSDTLCGLIECLDEEGLGPDEVQLFGVYRGKKLPLEMERCVDEQGKWLVRPEICRALEKHYGETLDERFKGHVADGSCAFDDRDREGSGPF
jgi:hypothetical protein